MKYTTEPAFSIQIYMAGDLFAIEQACRSYCMEKGFCVTVTPTKFIYTGGEETGVCVGIVNYPRFPATEGELIEHAKALTEKLITAAFQWTALIVTSRQSIWFTCKEERNGK